MPITIQITGNNAEEVRQLVADLAYALPRVADTALPETTVVTTLDEPTDITPPVAEAKPAEQPKAEQKPIKKQEPAKPTEPQPTLEEVRKALGTLSQQGKQAEVKKLIASFGANKLTEIDASQYGALLEKAASL